MSALQLRRLALLTATGVSWLAAPRAMAVPSFARATGFSCAQCHTQFPELTSFGRAFKVTGYTMVTKPTITSTPPDTMREILDFLQGAPLSAMVQASLTMTQQAVPGANGGTAQNASVAFPQQLSLFYAGRIAPELGAFAQVTFDGVADKFSIDNTDIRFAHTTELFDQDLTFGVTLNNNPTVTDLWHGTPAWGWPFAGSSIAPTPAASPLIAGALAQNVAGLTAYGLWDQLIYAEAGVYRSFPVGTTQPLGAGGDANNVIQAVAPYWRVAVQKDIDQHALELGTFGLYASLFPGGTAPLSTPTNQFLDLGFDAQYQYVGERHILSANASYIHESQTLDAASAAGASANASDDLSQLNISAGYIYNRLVGGRLGYFSTFGSTDTGLYAPAAVGSSQSGSPNSNGMIAEVNVTPWLNTKFSFQYVGYFNFNGSSSNYDGFGRNAVDNSTYYLLGWFAF